MDTCPYRGAVADLHTWQWEARATAVRERERERPEAGRIEGDDSILL